MDGSVGTDLSAGHVLYNLSDLFIRIKKNTATSWDFALGATPNGPWITYYSAQDVPTDGGFTPDQIGVAFLCIGTGTKLMQVGGIHYA